MTTDPIADYLTRIRNAIQAKKHTLEIPSSKLKKELTTVLHEKGYIKNFKFNDESSVQGIINIALKYDPLTKKSAIIRLCRVSKPGLRRYETASTIPSVINGLGISILSTSQGIMSDKEARKKNIGGEVLCYIY